MAAEELTALDAELAQSGPRNPAGNLLPPDPNEDRDAIVEIRAGTGGSEAALFRRRPCIACTRATWKISA